MLKVKFSKKLSNQVPPQQLPDLTILQKDSSVIRLQLRSLTVEILLRKRREIFGRL